jgi:hypothetical protein
MLRKTLFLALAATFMALLMASEAQAWGAAHVGFTHVGPLGGVQHYGRTVGVGPAGGVYSGGHVGAYGAYGGAYHAGYGYRAGYGGYAAGGFRAGGLYGGAYGAGVYRRW